MDLYIMRHGKAVESDPKLSISDDQRPLTQEGRHDLALIAAALKRMNIEFNLILSSPLLRARQTAEIVAKALGVTKKLRFSENLAQPKIKRVIEEIGELAQASPSILLVGHEPYLSELASTLLTGKGEMQITFKKGGMLKLKIQEVGPDQHASLEWHMAPRHLIAIAGD